ncbi:ABC transporter ATP-binding protein [Pseudomonas mohnii]|jgi:NitT/TauT family transport system ATP-binding protein|uniref:NitT/TauT family transport system ATP-binding protein n=1 Tax=Pseudomonas mohnii TaxID=395600 RepID=A0ABY0Y6G0_9PSED|nr:MULTISPECIES: ABC transporter ATP-binding protein [Pseudomonas]RZO09882.1 ABC transporter ATP-binding protein [Pseudomonas moorei]MBH8609638.1 ABC transporter ATP-binding protein [Pseudomonas mohnii]MBM6443411.1 ABC transporter ATP-binding protein [Pseudomonas sp. MIL9]POA79147.1 ABC transporter ATP-binding protein [Pseudomonas sp. DP16D-R1]SEC99589.1 NitT/TauT family transport system ATP-binding protein [Pseudomonas mohnii]
MGSVTAANHRFATPQATAVQAAPRLQVDKVSLRYKKPDGGTFTALEEVSFDVPDQQFAVLVGPSGCGKSSLLYLTAGLNEPTSGEIYVGGQQVQGPGADRGMVFQSYTLFPWLTVRQNVEFGLKRRGMPAAQRKDIVDYYVNEVGLSNFADNYAKQLSGGMMQRVAIARALANDPQILLMDEPFGALDSQTRLQMQQLLLRVWGHSKKTVLFVTHDIDEAILLGDRVYVMGARPGRIKQILDVPIERPRTLDMVMEHSFIDMKRKIFGLLHDDLEEVH